MEGLGPSTARIGAARSRTKRSRRTEYVARRANAPSAAVCGS